MDGAVDWRRRVEANDNELHVATSSVPQNVVVQTPVHSAALEKAALQEPVD
jgi:hypothetical protein